MNLLNLTQNKITYLGYNNLKNYKRGVENVIHFQSLASPYKFNYYVHWDDKNSVYRFGDLLCIGIKKDIFWIFSLNIILLKIKLRDGKLFIHSHNALMSIFGLFTTRLITVHDPLFYLMKVQGNRLFKLFWLLEKILYLRCDYIHFISRFAKNNSLITSKKKNTILYNTSHLENFFPKQVPKNILKKGFTNVLIVRSIEERALIDLIIDVAKILANEKYIFYIAGKGPMLDYYQKKVENNGVKNVKLLGYISDSELIEYYKNCSFVLVTASYGEGFGLPIIEGYLFGKPVFASNVCAIPEVIYSKEFLFENNTKSIVEKFITLRRTSIDFFEFYNKNYSNNNILSEMKSLYSKMI